MSGDYQHLAETIIAARKTKGWSQDDLVKASGLSRPTVQRLESGKPRSRPTKATIQALEHALGWLAGSVDAVLAGGVPAAGSYDGRFLRIQVDNASEVVHDLVRKISLAIDPEVPLSRIIQAEALAEEALREAGLLPPLEPPAPDDQASNE